MFRIPFRRFGVISLVILLAMVISASPTSAVLAIVTLADSNPQWVSGGAFQRTSLGQTNPGGVQLLATMTNPEWKGNHPLPQPLAYSASIGFHKQIFVVGGRSIENKLLTAPTNYFFGTQIDNFATGGLKPWVEYNKQGLDLPQGLSSVALATFEAGENAYLYVIGGLVTSDAGDVVSTDTVYWTRLQRDSSGIYHPQGWQTSAHPLPYEERAIYGSGASNIGATIHIVDGTPRLYLFGGRNRTATLAGFRDVYYSTVYWTDIDPLTGELTAWDTTPQDLIKQVEGGTETPIDGVGGTQAVTYTNPETGQEAVYLVGGRKARFEADSNTYSARFEPDGTLVWQPTVSLPFELVDHSAVAVNGGLFALGGTANPNETTPAPKNTIFATTLNDDLTVFDPGNGFQSFDELSGALGQCRMDHTNALIDAGIYGTWVYVIGGRALTTNDCSGTASIATPDVFIGQFVNSGQALTGSKFASNGNYYSKVFDFGEASSSYEAMLWTANLPQKNGGSPTSIQMGYRFGNDPRSLGAFIDVPLNTIAGSNRYDFPVDGQGQPLVSGRYFQFVARLSTSDPERTVSPLLDAVKIQIDRPGFPNLRTEGFTIPAFAPGNAVAPAITVGNRAYPGTAVIDVEFGDGTSAFYVDLFINPPSKPKLGDVGQVYAIVPKVALRADTAYQIPASSWRTADCGGDSCPPVNWNALFPQPGTYQVYVMVDSIDQANVAGHPWAYVNEAETAGTGGETDNVGGPYAVMVGNQTGATSMPTATLASTEAALTATAVESATAASLTATTQALPPPEQTATAASLTATTQALPPPEQTATAASLTATTQALPPPEQTATAAALTATTQALPPPEQTATAASLTATTQALPSPEQTATAAALTATAEGPTPTSTSTLSPTEMAQTATAGTGVTDSPPIIYLPFVAK